MKRCFWAWSAANMMLVWLPVASGLAQAAHEPADVAPAADAPAPSVAVPLPAAEPGQPEPAGAPPAEAPLPAPAAPVQPGAEGAPAEAAPAAALPAAAEAGQPASTGAPPAVAAEAPPVAEAPLSAPAASEPPPRSSVSSFVEAPPEVFEIDRSPQYPPTEPPAVSVPYVDINGWPTVVKPAPVKKSFWARLFGKQGAGAVEEMPPAVPPEVAAEAGQVAEGAVSSAAPAVRAARAPEQPEELLAAREDVRRQAKEIEGLKHLDLAYQAMGRNEWEEALTQFSLATNVMPVRPYTVDTRNKARQAQAQCEYRLAVKNFQQGNLGEAKRRVDDALAIAPNLKDARHVKGKIESALAAAPPGGPRKPTEGVPPRPPALRHDPDYLAKQRRIKEHINFGRQYMAMHEYGKAVREFNSVLLEDEGNEDANANLKKIAETGYDLETWQYERMKVDMMAQVRDTWTPPVKQEVVPPKPTTEATGILDTDRKNLVAKLNTIIIPQVEFRDANIVDAIDFLHKQSIIADKTSPAGEKGVNLMLNLNRPGAAGAVAAAPAAPEVGEVFPEGQGPAGAAAPAAAGRIPTISLKLSNIKLLEAIKYLTGITGLKYHIEPNAVIITPADVVYGDVITKTYRVAPDFDANIRSSIEEGEAAQAPAAIGVELAAPAARPASASVDVKRFFVQNNVPFPEGTSISYQKALNLLIVANTAENHEKLESILSNFNVFPKQVEIEARFVEIAQTDLEELGIEWLLTDDWEIAQDASAGASVPLSARKRIQANKSNVTKGLRELTDASGTTGPGGTLGNIFSISSILTNPELSVILHALEQKSGANLLSAPKVTTKNNSTATIKVVKEIIYPTEWTTGGGATGQQVATAVVQTPSSFEERDTGVILSVTPNVAADGYTIDLTLEPQVVELADWINYGSYIIDPQTLTPIPMNNPQPVFHSRSIQANIQIWDGQTVIMGGLITENETTTEDKIPFVGDIPLVGYLFKSKTNKSVKRNLLIFVTANLVDPAGNRINKKPITAVSEAPAAAPAVAVP